MKLPKIQYPVTEFTVPSTGKELSFRPFLVKEEKILLMAQQTKDKKEILKAIKQIINNCSVEKIDVNKLLIVDLEYLFLQLRAISVNNVVELTYTDNEDGEDYKFKVNLQEIEVKKPKKKVSNKIEVTPEIGLILKHGNGDTVDQMTDIHNESELMSFYIKHCIEQVYDKDNVYVMSEMEAKDIEEFVDQLPSTALEKIRAFFATAPRMEHVITYKNKKGSDRKIVLNTLEDFFTLL